MKAAVRTPQDLQDLLFTEILPLVSKPNRYVGNEIGLAEKDWDAVQVRFLLCYPDAYEVGMQFGPSRLEVLPAPLVGKIRGRESFSQPACHR